MRRTLLALMLVGAATAAPVPGSKVQPSRPVEDELALPPLGLAVEPGVKFATKDLDAKYADTGPAQEGLRQAVHEAQVLIWASTALTPPRELRVEVVAARKRMGMAPTLLQTEVLAPKTAPMEKQLKERIFAANRQLARVVAVLEAGLDELNAQEPNAAKENLRWQAHHATMTGALAMRLIHLNEYCLAMGMLRKEFPDRDPNKHRGWQMEPSENVRDVPGRKLLKAASKTLKDVGEARPGTVWAQASEQMLKTPLGVVWKAR